MILNHENISKQNEMYHLTFTGWNESNERQIAYRFKIPLKVLVIQVFSMLIRICQRPELISMTLQRHTFESSSDRLHSLTLSHSFSLSIAFRLIGVVVEFYDRVRSPFQNWIEFVFCATFLAHFGDYLTFKMAQADFSHSTNEERERERYRVKKKRAHFNSPPYHLGNGQCVFATRERKRENSIIKGWLFATIKALISLHKHWASRQIICLYLEQVR